MKEAEKLNETKSNGKYLPIKKCSKCGKTKTLDYFAPDQRTKDGRSKTCTQCKYNIEKWPDIPEGHKFCTTCAKVKPLDDFSIKIERYDGKHIYQSGCKKCQATYWTNKKDETLNSSVFKVETKAKDEGKGKSKDIKDNKGKEKAAKEWIKGDGKEFKEKEEEKPTIPMIVHMHEQRYATLIELLTPMFFPNGHEVGMDRKDGKYYLYSLYSSVKDMVKDMSCLMEKGFQTFSATKQGSKGDVFIMGVTKETFL
jgi:hypothetical protein